jgi:glutaminase
MSVRVGGLGVFLGRTAVSPVEKFSRGPDADVPFTIQSMTKPFTYGYAVNRFGRERVLRQVGVEPTGEAFNSIVLDDVNNRPFNPMVNAGAIAVSELMTFEDPRESEAVLLGLFSELAGRDVDVDERVYESERETGHRNRAIAYMMLNSRMIRTAPEKVLECYFRQCAVRVTAVDMAVMAATLANHGVNPVTGRPVFDQDVVQDVLTLMSTCGMYNYAGEWAYDVGIPAKSGVSGGIIAVIPGQLGISVYAPPLDAHGNSVRGVKVCAALSRDFSLHAFADRRSVQNVIRREYSGATISSKRIRSSRERDYLKEKGQAIHVIEVQGALYFGPAEVLTRRLTSVPPQTRCIVVDFKRASFSDQTANRLILETARALLQPGVQLAFSSLAAGGPLSDLLDLISSDPALEGLRLFDGTDDALEFFEDDLLEYHVGHARPTRFSLGELDLFRGIPKEEIRLLERLIESFEFAPGQTVVREGDDAHFVFIVAKGSASIFINLGDGTKRRVGSVGPGSSFGEMALLEGGRRSADVVADEKLICYGFPVSQFLALAKERPGLHAAILSNIVRGLSDRLRLANQEIRALE